MIQFETKSHLVLYVLDWIAHQWSNFKLKQFLNYDLQSSLGLVRSLDWNLFCMQLRTDIIHCLLLFMQLLWGKPAYLKSTVIYIVLQWCWKYQFQDHIRFVTRQKRADAKKALKHLLYSGGSSRFSFEVCFLLVSTRKLSFYIIIFYFILCCNDCLISMDNVCGQSLWIN